MTKKQLKTKTNIENADHPLRQMAIRIIEEVVEVHTGRVISGETYYKMEDDIVALLSNL